MDNNVYQAPESDLIIQDSEVKPISSRRRRLVASIIDSLVLGVALLPLIYFTGFLETVLAGNPSTLVEDGMILIASIAIFILLNGYLLAKNGQTIGKALLRIQIVSFAEGRILSLSAVLLKRYLPVYVLPYIPVVGQILSLADILFIFGSSKRCLHDHLADTKVVYCSAN